MICYKYIELVRELMRVGYTVIKSDKRLHCYLIMQVSKEQQRFERVNSYLNKMENNKMVDREIIQASKQAASRKVGKISKR